MRFMRESLMEVGEEAREFVTLQHWLKRVHLMMISLKEKSTILMVVLSSKNGKPRTKFLKVILRNKIWIMYQLDLFWRISTTKVLSCLLTGKSKESRREWMVRIEKAVIIIVDFKKMIDIMNSENLIMQKIFNSSFSRSSFLKFLNYSM